jgi:hypothetical protein
MLGVFSFVCLKTILSFIIETFFEFPIMGPIVGAVSMFFNHPLGRAINILIGILIGGGLLLQALTYISTGKWPDN